MKSFLYKICDRSIMEIATEYHNYLATLRKKNDRSFYKIKTINNVHLVEVNKTLNNYVSTHKKIFDFYLINCEFVIKIDNEFIANKKTDCFYETDIINIYRYFLYDIHCFKSRGQNLYNINQMAININSDRCKMTYEHYINQPMHMCERKIIMNIARNPHLINSSNRNKNHSRIRKC